MSKSPFPAGILSDIGNNKTLGLEIEKSFLEAEKTCGSPWVMTAAAYLPDTGITFHELLIILSVAGCVWNCLCAAYLICGHIFHWVRPDEQRQIIRIVLYIPIVSLLSLFSTYFYNSRPFNQPVATAYEGFAITSLYLLFLQYVCPQSQNRANFFLNLNEQREGKLSRKPHNLLKWFNRDWAFVFQITIVRIAAVTAQEVINGVTCPLSRLRSNATIAIQVIQGLSTGFAVVGVVQFERRMKNQLKGRQALLKLLGFKAIVVLESIQSILFPVLAKEGVFFPRPPYHVSWSDFAYGLPDIILIYEVAAMAFLFMWSFTCEPYRELVHQGEKPKFPTWKAFLSCFEIMDTVRGVKYMFTGFKPNGYPGNYGYERQSEAPQMDGYDETSKSTEYQPLHTTMRYAE